ncbi:MAG TPA: hypothetical protein VGF94_18630 [Kofleriaceae bacterium]
MPRPPTADLEGLLRALLDGHVELIVVGGAAAVIHGAPVTTQDLEIVPRRDAGDAERLLAVLTELGARFRPVRPDRDPELRVRVIDLETLIAIKHTTGRARDAVVVPLLLALRDRGGGS